MRPVTLCREARAEIEAHGRSAYPDEACGFLIGPADTEPRRVRRALPADNSLPVDARRRRFVIPPEALRAMESRLDGSGDEVLGFYHSHPDHPAAPSRFDEEHAWPWYTYLVLGVAEGRPETLAAFELDPETRAFHPVSLADAGPAPAASAAGPALGGVSPAGGA